MRVGDGARPEFRIAEPSYVPSPHHAPLPGVLLCTRLVPIPLTLTSTTWVVFCQFGKIEEDVFVS